MSQNGTQKPVSGWQDAPIVDSPPAGNAPAWASAPVVAGPAGNSSTAPAQSIDQGLPTWLNRSLSAIPGLGGSLSIGSQFGANALAGLRSIYDLARGRPLAQIDEQNQRDIAARTYNPVPGSSAALATRAMASPVNPLNWPGKLFDVIGQSINSATDPRTWAGRVDTPSGNPLLSDKAMTANYETLLGGKPRPFATLPTTGTGSTALGPIVSGALQLASSALPAMRSVPQALRGVRPLAEPPVLGMRSPQSVSAAAALPPTSGAAPELQQALAAARRGTVNPDVLTRHLEADSLPVKVQLTQGQATQSPTLLSQEMNLRGRFPALADRLNQQNGQLVQNIQSIRDTVGPDVFSTNPVEHGETLINAYKAKDAAAQADIAAKYQALQDANGGQFPVDARALLDSATAQLHKQLLFEHAPSGPMAQLARMADSGSMTMEQFEALRTNLARIQRTASDGNERPAAGVIRNAMEQLPMSAPSGAVKALADSARSAARAQFQALDADPAYSAAVNDTVPADRFVSRFVINAPRDDVALTRQNLADNPTATQTLGVATLDHLRNSAGIDADGNGNFSAPRYTRALQALSPKLRSLVDPKTADQLETLGNVARYTQSQPRGSFVNNSNTLVGSMANYGVGALEGAANVAAHGVPVGTWSRGVMRNLAGGRFVKQATAPGAGLTWSP